MKTTQTRTQFASLSRDYAGLCRLLTPRRIHDKVDLANVVEITDALAGRKLSPDQEDYFDLLCSLIEAYEREYVPAPKAGGLETLRHLLAVHGMKAADLSRLLGTHRTLGAMILRGDRQLTLEHVRVLAKYFKVSADLFLN
ncbi:MAG: transcriptional regulator [Opitutus sp.]|nr:transcriptional regulator [Opitutus sp.]